jgi:hypothetical protein
MTTRRLRVLIQHLPPESATMTALRNAMTEEELAEQAEKGEPERARWSQLEQLTAATVDAVRRVEYVLTLANLSSKARKPAAPEPLRRPGAQARRPRPQLSEASADMLARFLNGGAAASC